MVQALSNRRGMCVHHSEIRLQVQLDDRSWKVLFNRCPECVGGPLSPHELEKPLKRKSVLVPVISSPSPEDRSEEQEIARSPKNNSLAPPSQVDSPPRNEITKGSGGGTAASALTDQRGMCVHHSEVRLQVQLDDRSWKVLFNRCPECVGGPLSLPELEKPLKRKSVLVPAISPPSSEDRSQEQEIGLTETIRPRSPKNNSLAPPSNTDSPPRNEIAESSAGGSAASANATAEMPEIVDHDVRDSHAPSSGPPNREENRVPPLITPAASPVLPYYHAPDPSSPGNSDETNPSASDMRRFGENIGNHSSEKKKRPHFPNLRVVPILMRRKNKGGNAIGNESGGPRSVVSTQSRGLRSVVTEPGRRIRKMVLRKKNRGNASNHSNSTQFLSSDSCVSELSTASEYQDL